MTWLDLPADHPFGVDNLPYGVFSERGGAGQRRVGVRIGDQVLDAGTVAAIGRDAGLVGDGPDLATAWLMPSLNAFLALGRPAWTVARQWLTELGNPYVAVAVDKMASAAIDYGVYKAPESFLVNPEGVIVHKVVGVITPQIWRDKLLPMIEGRKP